MTFARWSVSLIVIIGIGAAAVAGAVIWLIVTDPVTAADKVSTMLSTGDVSPVVQAIGAVLYDALRGLFRFL